MTHTYLARITPWHRNRPNFVATVDVSVRPFWEEQNFLKALPLAFDIDTAVGAQLDVVGQWVGRSRYIPVPLDDLWFTFDVARKGFDKGIWKGPYATGVGFTRLDDTFYRALLKAKILCNKWDGTAEDAQAIFTAYLGRGNRAYVEDRCRNVAQTDGVNADQASVDMSMLVVIAGQLPADIAMTIISQNLLPLKPAGVKTTYLMTSVDLKSAFGFDVDNGYIAGFDRGAFAIPMGRTDLLAAA